MEIEVVLPLPPAERIFGCPSIFIHSFLADWRELVIP